MAGGLISIATYGSNDLYLTGAPQVTFFKIVYRRYTNFSTESIKIAIDDTLEFNKASEVPIPKIGDLMFKTYLEINIPEVSFTYDDMGVDFEPTELDTSYAEDYDTVIQFMKLNTNAYRVATEYYNAQNTTAEIMMDAIRNVFSDAEIDEGGGVNITDVINSYTTLINSFVNAGEFSMITTNIQDVIETLDSVSGLTKDIILSRVRQAIENSITVQKFFFTKLQNAINENNEANKKTVKFAWVDRLGHFIIDYVDVYIGGERIDRHYGDWMNVWYELASNKNKEDAYLRMIGDVDEMTAFDKNPKPRYKLTIPLNFWFCRHNGLAFPLIGLQYNDLSVRIKLKRLEDCSYVEKIVDDDIDISLSDLWDDKGYFLTGNLMVDYVFLDGLERKKFAQSAHEYLIETLQVIDIRYADLDRQQIKFDFKHPCKEIIWTVQKEAYIDNTTSFSKSLCSNYSLTAENKGNPILYASLDFNGYSRVDKFRGSYFNYVQPNNHHSNTPADGINVYSFALKPEEHQPSCTCNFSKINSSILYLYLDPSVFRYKRSDIDPSIIPDSDNDEILTTSVRIRVYTTSYNIMRIVGGYAGTAYS